MRSMTATSSVPARAAACVIALVLRAHGAELHADRSGTIESSFAAEPAALRQPVRVQPRASQFAAPYKPDVSPESARAVDQLYDELMRRTPAPVRGERPVRRGETAVERSRLADR